MDRRKQVVPGYNSLAVSRTSLTLLGFYLGLAALVVLVFGQTIHFRFVNYDDGSYVYQNSHILSGLSWRNTAWAFTHVHSANWHPLTTLSHMADCQVFGLESSGPHAVNVLLHLVTALLLFTFLRLTTGQVGCAWVAATLFAIHPLRAESVAWISERKDVLSGLFFVLTLLAYLCYTRRPGLARYLVTMLVLAAGLMSKPMLVSVPVILLLLDFWPLKRAIPIGRLLLEKIPFALLSLASAVGTLLAQRLALGTPANLPLRWRLVNAVSSYANYLRQMLWPVDLIPFYPHPEASFSSLTLAATVLMLLALSATAFVYRRRFPWVGVGWLWYLIMLIPVIGVVQVGLQARADRYTYLPQIGIILAVVWSIRALLQSRAISIGISLVTIAATAALAYRQTSHWRETEALWSYTLTKSPDNDVALTGLAGIQLVRGETAQAKSNYERAVELRPGNGAAQHGLALALWKERKVDAAIEHWEKSLADQPDNNDARNYLGVALADVGRDDEAIQQWRSALAFDPDDGNANNNLAWLLATSRQGTLRQPKEAILLAEHATTLPGGENPAVFRTVAAAYAADGQFDAAIKAAGHAVELAERSGKTDLVKEMNSWLDLFRRGRPAR